MRAKHKWWKNGVYPKWTVRIIWYEEGDGENIRLAIEDCEKKVNLFPNTKAKADIIWDEFKRIAPPEGEQLPIVDEIVEMFKD